MESSSTNSVLRVVALLSMLVVSLASNMNPQDAAGRNVAAQGPTSMALTYSKISLVTCFKKCGIANARDLSKPSVYATNFVLCTISCMIPSKEANRPAETWSDMQASLTTSSDAHVSCTRNCVSLMAKVLSINAKAVNALAKLSHSDLERYVEGYVDACNLSCNKNPQLF